MILQSVDNVYIIFKTDDSPPTKINISRWLTSVLQLLTCAEVMVKGMQLQLIQFLLIQTNLIVYSQEQTISNNCNFTY